MEYARQALTSLINKIINQIEEDTKNQTSPEIIEVKKEFVEMMKQHLSLYSPCFY